MFVVVVQLAGGVSSGDYLESAIPTYALAHGHVACMFPAVTGLPWAIAPIYPIISGSIVAVGHLGATVPFPAGTHHGCATVIHAFARSVNLLRPDHTLQDIAWLGWVVLAGGVAAFLVTTDRVRTRWELLTAGVLAVSPPVFECLTSYLHPEGLVAVGLVFGALACLRRGIWFTAGVLCALAVLTHQSAMLAVLAVIVVAPSARLVRLLGGLLITTVIVMVPLAIVTSGRAITSLSGRGFSLPGNDTWIGYWNPSGSTMWLVSRVLPFVAVAVIALVTRRRLGPDVLAAHRLVALVTVSFAMRLAFEGVLYDYYFMAVAVCLVVLDVARGRVRAMTILWLVLVTIAFDPLVGRANPAQFVAWLPDQQIVLVGLALWLGLRSLWGPDTAITDSRVDLPSDSSRSSSLPVPPASAPATRVRR